ncbi:hypothetical protein ACH5AL_37690 [Actinacidiphila glaucinigra]|uniref:hypothetical protein n=1 Tax=Actinacidiphila glaucinigra TaxID=235986 RepID=UPI00378EE58C
MKPGTVGDTEASDSGEAAAVAAGAGRPTAGRSRVRILIAGIATLICAALAVTVIVSHSSGGDTSSQRRSPATIPAGYTVSGHGVAQIAYPGVDGRLRTVTTRLPWHEQADLNPAARSTGISVVLGKDGGTATCTLVLHGKPVQQATAEGPYARANCRTAATSTAP